MYCYLLVSIAGQAARYILRASAIQRLKSRSRSSAQRRGSILAGSGSKPGCVRHFFVVIGCPDT